MTNDITLSDEIIERISDWLCEADSAEPDNRPSITPLMEDLSDLDLDEVLPYFENSIVLSPDGYSRYFLIPIGEWSWSADLAAEQLVVVGQFGSVNTATLDELRADRSFWLEPGFEVHALDWFRARQLPFRFDGVMWCGTEADSAFGEGEWMLRFNGDEEMFDLSEMDLAFIGENAKPGRWLSIESDGYSVSTGEIGVTMYVTKSGGLFRYEWGYRDTLIGHAKPDLDVEDILGELDPENLGFSNVMAIESDIFGKKQMRQIVQWVLDKDINLEDSDEVSVECPTWSGTAAELLS